MLNLIPHLIDQQLRQQRYAGRFSAVTMFVDISGFTPLTDTLMQHRSDGAEALSAALNGIFGPLVHDVYARGGFIASFAGDAFTAVFPLRRRDAALHAAQSALFVARFFDEQGQLETPYGRFLLSARVGLSAGNVQWGILGQEKHRTYFFRGEAIDGCAQAQHYAKAVVPVGGVVADARVWPHLQGQVQALPLGGAHYKLVAPLQEPSSRTCSLPPMLGRETLAPFVLDAVLDLTGGGGQAEFRQVAAAFISMEEPRDQEQLGHFVSAVVEAAVGHGGYFNKLDFGDKGSVMLILFGAPLAHEDDLERAVDLLLSLRSETSAFQVRWRAGLAFGTVYAGVIGGEERCEYTAIGNVVNLASRLMLQADWGQVLVPLTVAQHPALETVHVGDFQYKGFSAPLPTYRLVGHSSGQLPFFEQPLVGRQAELQHLFDAAAPLFAGRFAGAAIVYGEPGIGKSHLVYALRQALQQCGSVAWFTAMPNQVQRQAFGPSAGFLRSYFGQSPSASPAENKARFEQRLARLVAELESAGSAGQLRPVAELASELARSQSVLGALVGLHWPGSLYETLDARGRYENTLFAIKTLLLAESCLHPVVLHVEDAQWLNEASQEVLATFTRNVDGYPLLVLITSRYADDGSKPSFNLSGDIPTSTFDLGPLAPEELLALADSILGGPIDDKLFEVLLDRSQANPFFAQQLLAYFRESDLLVRAMGPVGSLGPLWMLRETAHLDLPSGISAVLTARIDRLTHAVKEVVKAASVLGREFEVRVLAHVLQSDVWPEVQAACRSQIWAEIDELHYLFTSALLRDAAYSMQLRMRLRQVHALALVALETVYADNLAPHYGELVYHAEGSQNVEKQREYYARAGEAAQATYSNAAALEYYARLLPLLKTAEEQIDVRLKMASVLELVGHWNEAEGHYRQALALAGQNRRTVDQARCQQALGALARQRGDYGPALDWLSLARSGWEASGDQIGMSRALSEMGTVFWRQGDFPRALASVQESLALARVTDDTRGMGLALNIMGNIALYQHDYNLARRFYEESLALRRKLGDRREIGGSLNNLALVADAEGDPKTALELHRESMALAREVGDRMGIVHSLNNQGWLAKNRGDVRLARALFEEYLAMCREVGDKWGISIGLNNLGLVLLEIGDFEEAHEIFQEDVLVCDELGDRGAVSNALCNQGTAFFGQGDYQDAQKYFSQALSLRLELQLPGPIFCLVGLAGTAAQVALSAGNEDLANRSVQLLSFFEAQWADVATETVYLQLADRTQAAVRQLLTAEGYDDAWAAGRVLSLEQAIATARLLATAGQGD